MYGGNKMVSYKVLAWGEEGDDDVDNDEDFEDDDE